MAFDFSGLSDFVGGLFGGGGGGGGMDMGGMGNGGMGGFTEAMNFTPEFGGMETGVGDGIFGSMDVNPAGAVAPDLSDQAMGDYGSTALENTGGVGQEGQGGIFGSLGGAFKGIGGMDGLGKLAQLGMAYQQFGANQDKNKFMMDYMKQAQLDKQKEGDRYRQSLNNQLRDRQHGRNVNIDENGNRVQGHHIATDEYMNQNRIT